MPQTFPLLSFWYKLINPQRSIINAVSLHPSWGEPDPEIKATHLGRLRLESQNQNFLSAIQFRSVRVPFCLEGLVRHYRSSVGGEALPPALSRQSQDKMSTSNNQISVLRGTKKVAVNGRSPWALARLGVEDKGTVYRYGPLIQGGLCKMFVLVGFLLLQNENTLIQGNLEDQTVYLALTFRS